MVLSTKKLRSEFESAVFVSEAHRLDQLPADEGCEIAFVGRSNAGKSSVINRLCGRRRLARTSRTPGRTQQFVVFELSPMRRLIDLPGFGFAKVSKSKRAHWGKVIPRYLETRRSLIGLVLVIDSRHPFKQEEKELLHWCAEADLPVLALLNKSDKLKQKEKHTAKKNAQQIMHEMPIFVEALLYSAETGERTDQIFDVITPWFKDTAPAGELSDGEV